MSTVTLEESVEALRCELDLVRKERVIENDERKRLRSFVTLVAKDAVPGVSIGQRLMNLADDALDPSLHIEVGKPVRIKGGGERGVVAEVTITRCRLEGSAVWWDYGQLEPADSPDDVATDESPAPVKPTKTVVSRLRALAENPTHEMTVSTLLEAAAHIELLHKKLDELQDSLELTAAGVAEEKERNLNSLRYIERHVREPWSGPGFAAVHEEQELSQSICSALNDRLDLRREHGEHVERALVAESERDALLALHHGAADLTNAERDAAPGANLMLITDKSVFAILREHWITGRIVATDITSARSLQNAATICGDKVYRCKPLHGSCNLPSGHKNLRHDAFAPYSLEFHPDDVDDAAEGTQDYEPLPDAKPIGMHGAVLVSKATVTIDRPFTLGSRVRGRNDTSTHPGGEVIELFSSARVRVRFDNGVSGTYLESDLVSEPFWFQPRRVPPIGAAAVASAREASPPPVKMTKAHYLGAPELWRLNEACRALGEAFESYGVYLVGSSLERPDYRDVDIRAIVPDERFAQLFPELAALGHGEVTWNYKESQLLALINASISLMLSQQTGLKVDFQVQAQTLANTKYPRRRNSLGWVGSGLQSQVKP